MRKKQARSNNPDCYFSPGREREVVASTEEMPKLLNIIHVGHSTSTAILLRKNEPPSPARSRKFHPLIPTAT